MKKSIVKDKSFKFALLIIDVYKSLQLHKEFVISKQLLRSGTSIGANINEAIAAEIKADFIHKMSISSKEARETSYWLELLDESRFVNIDFSQTRAKCAELVRLLTSIIKTSKLNSNIPITKNS